MADKAPEIKKIVVTEGGKQSTPIFIPQSGDRVYDHELELWATENERRRMKNKPEPKPSRLTKEDRKAVLREMRNYTERKKQGIKRYF